MSDPLPLDLFGDPVVPPKPGRPSHEPTQALRDRVVICLALGWSNARIANALRCSLPTLRKHYKRELKARDMQRDRFDAWRFEKTMAEAETGNIGALRLLDKMVEKNDRMLADQRIRAAQAQDDDNDATEPVGKKVAARKAAADVAVSGWGGLLNPESYKN